jgi:Fe-S cluster biogenesis protein NfuA
MNINSSEPTPNPNAFKFILDEELASRPRSFQSIDAASSDPLATSLFEIEGLESVFYYENFVTVAKQEEADWEAVMTEAGQRLIDFDASTLPAEEAVVEEQSEGGETSEILAKINVVIDEMVRPALADDGGGLEVLGVDQNTVFIRYQGACGTCPSATSGTLMAIERLIQHQIGPDLKVIPA